MNEKDKVRKDLGEVMISSELVKTMVSLMIKEAYKLPPENVDVLNALYILERLADDLWRKVLFLDVSISQERKATEQEQSE